MSCGGETAFIATILLYLRRNFPVKQACACSNANESAPWTCPNIFIDQCHQNIHRRFAQQLAPQICSRLCVFPDSITGVSVVLIVFFFLSVYKVYGDRFCWRFHLLLHVIQLLFSFGLRTWQKSNPLVLHIVCHESRTFAHRSSIVSTWIQSQMWRNWGSVSIRLFIYCLLTDSHEFHWLLSFIFVSLVCSVSMSPSISFAQFTCMPVCNSHWMSASCLCAIFSSIFRCNRNFCVFSCLRNWIY